MEILKSSIEPEYNVKAFYTNSSIIPGYFFFSENLFACVQLYTEKIYFAFTTIIMVMTIKDPHLTHY